MKRHSFCKAIILSLIVITAVVLSGCGKVRSVNSLYSQAKREHGACTIVSKSETDEKTLVVLHDKLQDFDYEVSSYMNDIVIDGASFGSLPSDSDTFDDALRKKVLENKKTELDEICAKYDSYYELDGSFYIFAPDAKTAEKVSLECARVIQEENLQSRLDGMMIYTGGNEYEKHWDNEHFGSVVLPDMKWCTPEDELIDYYTEMAHIQTDENAVFIRTERGTFADTGAKLDRVVSVLGTDYPQSMNDEVTFYYFRSSSGKEYYLCDFNYYDEEYYQMAWYTNYSG